MTSALLLVVSFVLGALSSESTLRRRRERKLREKMDRWYRDTKAEVEEIAVKKVVRRIRNGDGS